MRTVDSHIKQKETEMNTTRMTGTIKTATVSFLLALAVVLSLGVMTAHEAAARDFSLKASTSVGTRTQAQSDLCTIGGGETGVSTSSTGSTLTQCVGGDSNGMTCLNSANYTSCHMPRLLPPGDSHPGEIPVAGVALDPESTTSESDDTNEIDQAPVIADAPSVAPEPTASPENDTAGIGQDVVAEESTEVAPEPTAAPENDNETVQGVVTDEPLAVDPGTEGDASSKDGGPYVDVLVGDGGTILDATVDEQP
jgi:hypothetical protein